MCHGSCRRGERRREKGDVQNHTSQNGLGACAVKRVRPYWLAAAISSFAVVRALVTDFLAQSASRLSG